MKSFLSFLFMGMLIFLSYPSNAKVIKVPTDFSSIQSAINHSENGDTVVAERGRYYENINYRGKNIVVSSNYLFTTDTTDIIETIIDGSKPLHKDSAACVAIISKENAGAMLVGFTLTKGKGTIVEGYVEGGGVLTYGSSPIIRNNLIIENDVSAGGGGIAGWRGNPTLINNVIAGNKAAYAAGLVLNWSGGTVRNNVICQNIKSGTSWPTGGLMIWDSGPYPQIVENNTIIGNASSTTAGGMSIDKNANPLVNNNLIWGNVQYSGKQITGTKKINYCNVEDGFEGEGNFSSFPGFESGSFGITPESPCVDAGNGESIYNDQEDDQKTGIAKYPSLGSIRNDVGAFGGKGASIMNYIKINSLWINREIISYRTINKGSSVTKSALIVNLSLSDDLQFDSITWTNKEITCEYPDKAISPLSSDSIYIRWNAISGNKLADTIMIYHRFKNTPNPQKIVITGKSQEQTSVIQNQETDDNLKIYPNPGIGRQIIQFSLLSGGHVSLRLLDMNGKVVSKILDDELAIGNHQYELDTQYFKRGIYYLQLTSEQRSQTKKMVLI